MSSDVVLLARYGPRGASSRVRMYQYLPALEAAGVRVETCAMFSDAYVAARHGGRAATAASAAAAFVRRAAQLARLHPKAALWVEYEILPWLPFAAERAFYSAPRPVVVEYDDAIFHRYDQSRSALVRRWLGDKISRIMRAATVVIAGNDYLARYARDAGAAHVEIVPSVIDLSRYRQRDANDGARFVVGWVGSGSTTPYLREIEPALRAMRESCPRLAFRSVGGTAWSPAGIAVETLPWSLDTEVDAMLGFDVGVMPLPDEPWTRGKCGYKLIQYMGCGLPVVASPVGVNASIVEHGRTGFLASSTAEWTSALRSLAGSVELRAAMGRAGLEKVRRDYDLAVTAPRIASLMRALTERKL